MHVKRPRYKSLREVLAHAARHPVSPSGRPWLGVRAFCWTDDCETIFSSWTYALSDLRARDPSLGIPCPGCDKPMHNPHLVEEAKKCMKKKKRR